MAIPDLGNAGLVYILLSMLAEAIVWECWLYRKVFLVVAVFGVSGFDNRRVGVSDHC